MRGSVEQISLDKVDDLVTYADSGDVPPNYAADMRGLRIDIPGTLGIRDFGTQHRYASYPSGIAIVKGFNFNVIAENKEYDLIVGTDSSTNTRMFVGDGSHAITGATNATPIVITSASHGYFTNDVVIVTGVLGNTAANGTWAITKIDADTFSLTGSVGNGAYTSGGYVSRWNELTEYISATIDSVSGQTAVISSLTDILGTAFSRALPANYLSQYIGIASSVPALITASTAYTGSGTVTLTLVNSPINLGWGSGQSIRLYRFTGYLPDEALGTGRGYVFSNGATPHLRFLDLDAQAKLTLLYGDSNDPTTARQDLQIRKSKFTSQNTFTLGGGSGGWTFRSAIAGAIAIRGVAVGFKAITGVSTGTPIQVTSTAHGLTTGDRVYISGCAGNTGANGAWTITVTGADTFTLNTSTGIAGTYTSGTGVIERTWVCQENGSTLYTDDGGLTFTNVTGVSVALRKIRFFEIRKDITGATAASPVVITSNGHGFSNGDTVTIQDVGGITGASGIWEIANITANTFELVGSVGGGAYTSGGVAVKMNWNTLYTVGDNQTVLKRTDARATAPGAWTDLNGGATKITTTNLLDIGIIDANNIAVVGTTRAVWVTVDGGANWTNKPVTSFGVPETATGIHLRSATECWVCTNTNYGSGGNGHIFHTTNLNAGSPTWSADQVTSTGAFAIKMYTSTLGWCTCDDGVFYKTTNGTAWTQQVSPSSYGLFDIDLFSSVVERIATDQGGVMVTSDGSTWASEYFPVTNHMLAIDMIDSGNGYTVGTEGTVMRLTGGGAGTLGSGSSSGWYVDKAQLLPDSVTVGSRTSPKVSGDTAVTVEVGEGLRLKFEFQTEAIATASENDYVRMYGTPLYVGLDGVLPIQEGDPVFQLFLKPTGAGNFSSAKVTVSLDMGRINKSFFGIRFYLAMKDVATLSGNANAWVENPDEYIQAYDLLLTTAGWVVSTTDRYSHSNTANEFTYTKAIGSQISGVSTITANLGHVPDMTRAYVSPRFIVRGYRNENAIVAMDQDNRTLRLSAYSGAGVHMDDSFPDITNDNSNRRQKVALNGRGNLLGLAILNGNVYAYRNAEVEIFDLISGIPKLYPCDFVAKESLVGIGLNDSPYGLAYAGEHGLYLMAADGSQQQLLNGRQKNLYDGTLYIQDLPKAITGATNAAPIVITAASHGYATGNTVTITGVGGNTAANGTWVITVLTTNTFSLNGSIGNGAYTSGGSVKSASGNIPYITSAYRQAILGGYDQTYRELWFQIQANVKDGYGAEYLQFRYNIETRKCNIRKLHIGQSVANIGTSSRVDPLPVKYFTSKKDKSLVIGYASGLLRYPNRESLAFEDDVSFAGVTASRGIETLVKINCSSVYSLDPNTVVKNVVADLIAVSQNSNFVQVNLYANGESNPFDTFWFRSDHVRPNFEIRRAGEITKLEIEILLPFANATDITNLTQFKRLELKKFIIEKETREFIGNL